VVALSDERPIAFDREALISSLREDERFRALGEAMAESERHWTETIARQILLSGRPLDQRKVDETRGYFKAVRYMFTGRIDAADQRLALQANIHQDEESDRT
jgi:hypothetical protein